MGKEQVHKRLGTEAVKDILVRYDEKRLDFTAALVILGIKRSRFFKLLSEYRNNPKEFSVDYERETPKRITAATEAIIKKELLKEKQLITDPLLPITEYNYSALHDTLRDAHHIEVSAKTIIRRAKECGVGVTYALSPQAKGKVERSYRWLQARVVRQCARDHVTKFNEVRDIFRGEIERYNNRQVCSTTKEIPSIRFENAIRDGHTMFRPFLIPEPFQSAKDIFCLKDTRVVDAYRKISLHNLKITVPKVPPNHPVEIRMVPDRQKKSVELRLWFRGELVSVQIFKEQDLPAVQF